MHQVNVEMKPLQPVVEGREAVAVNGVSVALTGLQSILRRAGWEIAYIDLDFTIERPVVDVKCIRGDGRWFWAKVDSSGLGSFEVFHRDRWLGRPRNATGRFPLSPQIDDIFLSRVKTSGARSLLRHMARYVTDNAVDSISLGEMRAALAGTMLAPIRTP